jgi:hypothetical protein
MATNEIEEHKSNVPALANTPALDIGAEDVALPRLKIGQYMSAAVQEGDVEAGVLFTSLGADDPDPVVAETPLLIHIIGMTRGKSVSEDGELITYDYHDPDAPADAWVTYNYVAVLPEVDPDFPVKWLLTRTGRPAAQQLNIVLAKTSAAGPPWTQAFEITTAERENKKGKYYVPRVRHVEAKPENIEIAEKLAVMVSPDAASVQSSGDEPSI